MKFYKFTTVKKNGKRTTVSVHRKVWEENYGAIPDGMVIHHKNSIKDDNRIENLEMMTQTENMQRSDRMGKGWVFYKNRISRPYRAIRKFNGKGVPKLGFYGTPCGAYMASRTSLL